MLDKNVPKKGKFSPMYVQQVHFCKYEFQTNKEQALKDFILSETEWLVATFL